MSTKHAFINPNADGTDDTITRPSDWNEEHVFVQLHSEKTTNYTLLSTDEVIIFNGTAASVITMPDPTGNDGKEYSIINKYTSTANITFSRSINGDSTFALQPGEVINFMSDAVEYLVHK